MARSTKVFLKWFFASSTIGASTVYAYNTYKSQSICFQDDIYYTDWKTKVYRSFPFNLTSRIVGRFSDVYIPVVLREPIFSSFVRFYACRMDEAVKEDLRDYSSFSDLFNRELKPHLRPISDAPLISPADGIVVHCGKVEGDRVLHVKGNSYSLKEFIGPIECRKNERNDLYQMIIYLAPGDYHGFHSAAVWNADSQIHYPGLLLSVRPALLERIPNLFCVNERVVLTGDWLHGFFSLVAVAARNVGDIMIHANPLLQTNRRRFYGKYEPTIDSGFKYEYKAGEKVGEFKLGSTIVLIFEAPSTIKFAVKAGDRLRYGQSLIIKDI